MEEYKNLLDMFRLKNINKNKNWINVSSLLNTTIKTHKKVKDLDFTKENKSL